MAIYTKTGEWTLAPVLEEVPTDGMIGELHEDFVESLAKRLKIHAKAGLA